MIRRCVILFSMLYLCIQLTCQAQNTNTSRASQMFITRGWVYKGDTIPWIQLRTVHVFEELKFKKKKDYEKYQRLIRDVKKEPSPARKNANATSRIWRKASSSNTLLA